MESLYAHLNKRCAYALVAVCLLFAFSHAAGAVATDLRVAIDVSGSMKHNDPANLRAPALRLLVGLLPEGEKAGVWTFGKYVNMAVRHGRVDAKWKALARQQADAIHSRGLFTNIEAVLEKASRDWTRPDKQSRRHLILLTDGMVDISKNRLDNGASRERILKRILPRLRKVGVKVHTIALSDNADNELLESLSRVTDGWHEKVSDAGQLQKVFLRLFEKSTPMENLPITNNYFQVDANVSDMTLLVFKKAGVAATAVITPAGETWTAANHVTGTSWFDEKGYDLITVKRPQEGKWQIKADVDPDNRVMVLTNLRLQVNDLPNNLLPDDVAQIVASLQQKGETISNPGFLQLVRFSADHESPNGEKSEIVLSGSAKDAGDPGGKGMYRGSVSGIARTGVHEIVVRAKGATFERIKRHLVQVFSSPLDIQASLSEAGDAYEMMIQPYTGLMQPESVSIEAVLGGEMIELINQEHKRWLATVPAGTADQVITFAVKGQRFDKRPLDVQVEHTLAGTGGEEAAIPDDDNKPAEKDSDKEQGDENTNEAHEENPGGKKKAKKISWLKVSMYVLLINLVLFGGGFGGYFLWKKIRSKKIAEKEEEVSYE